MDPAGVLINSLSHEHGSVVRCKRELDTSDGIIATKLLTHRADCDMENNRQLDVLSGEKMSYCAIDEGVGSLLEPLRKTCPVSMRPLESSSYQLAAALGMPLPGCCSVFAVMTQEVPAAVHCPAGLGAAGAEGGRPGDAGPDDSCEPRARQWSAGSGEEFQRSAENARCDVHDRRRGGHPHLLDTQNRKQPRGRWPWNNGLGKKRFGRVQGVRGQKRLQHAVARQSEAQLSMMAVVLWAMPAVLEAHDSTQPSLARRRLSAGTEPHRREGCSPVGAWFWRSRAGQGQQS